MTTLSRDTSGDDQLSMTNRKYKLKRIQVWFVLSLAYLLVYFHRVSPSVTIDQIINEFHIMGAATAGGLAATYFYVYAAMQIPSGVLADSIDPKKTIITGLAIASLGSLAFGGANSLIGLYLARFMIGLGVSVIYVSIIKSFTIWFRPDEFGTVVGLTLFVGNVGAMLGTTPLAMAVGGIGWRLSFAAIGAITILVALLIGFVLRKPEKGTVLPESEGKISPDPFPKASLWQTIFKREIWQAVVIVLRNRYTWPALVISFGTYGPLMAFSGIWEVPYLMQIYQMDRAQAANHILVLTLGNAIGSFAIGYVSDRLKRRKAPYFIFASGNLLTWALIVFWHQGRPPVESLYALNFLLGFFASSSMLSMVCTKEVNDPRMAGISAGVGNLGGFAGAALLQPFLGYVLDLKWDGSVLNGSKFYSLSAFTTAFEVCLVVALAALVSVLLLKETRCQNAYMPQTGNFVQKASTL